MLIDPPLNKAILFLKKQPIILNEFKKVFSISKAPP